MSEQEVDGDGTYIDDKTLQFNVDIAKRSKAEAGTAADAAAGVPPEPNTGAAAGVPSKPNARRLVYK